MDTHTVSFLPIGGVGDVTRNMYVYSYQQEMLLVDCGLGFADQNMLGVDLLLPDITPILKSNKAITGMVLTHGHEDHIGALPYILPQLPNFPIYATPLTAALANEKLAQYGIHRRIQTVPFEKEGVRIGSFDISFIRVTHSVPDTAHLFIRTPVGNFYHGSDFKFDLTPADGKKTDFAKIVHLSSQGVLCMLSDALGAERQGHTLSESFLTESFEEEMRKCPGRCIVTTYSSNISRLNQAIAAAQKTKRRVCFVGRSLIKAKDVAQDLKLLQIERHTEISIDQLKKYPDNQILLIVAGSQGQENSAMTRMVMGEHKDIKLKPNDVIIFSADPIPGNELAVNSLVDNIAKKGARAVYHESTDSFHVSGHGAADDLMLLMNLVRPQSVMPIGATYRHMAAYKELAKKQGYADKHILLLDDGQELIFTRNDITFGEKIAIKNVYVDQVSGEEVDNFVLRDRQKLSEEGVVIILLEIDVATGSLVGKPNMIARGLPSKDVPLLHSQLKQTLEKLLPAQKDRVTDWTYIRKHVNDGLEQYIFKTLHRRPLVLPVVIEV